MNTGSKVAIGTVSTVAVGAGAYGVYQAVVNGQPIAQTASNAVDAARQTVATGVGWVAPTYRNQGSRATPEQIQAWCRKVNRVQGARGINEVARVATSPYINAQFPLDLHGFAVAAGEGARVGIKGGTILAVLLSVETNAGISPRAACWNHNAGNFKLYSQQWHAAQTPPCYFLVDRHPSLDFYPSFGNWEDGIREWAARTFANDRYNRFGTMDALRGGDLRAFTRAIGAAGYAAMYRNPRSMDARFQRLAGLGRFSRNRAVIDGSQVTLNPSIQ